MAPFLESLAREDLAAAALRGYRYDLRHFLGWQTTVLKMPSGLDRLTEFDLIARGALKQYLDSRPARSRQSRCF